MKAAFVLFDRLTALDFVGAYELSAVARDFISTCWLPMAGPWALTRRADFERAGKTEADRPIPMSQVMGLWYSSAKTTYSALENHVIGRGFSPGARLTVDRRSMMPHP